MHTFLFCRSAQVNCLYFVARETLDDVLWKLIEKKFRDLGEFVEGQEKLKLVIDKEYRGAKELQSALFHVEDDGSDDEDGPTDTTNVDRELEFDADLVHDIEEMGEEEERMLRLSEDPDDDIGGEVDVSHPLEPDMKMAAREPTFERSASKGLTEDDAIALSDDEDGAASTKPSINGTALAEHSLNSKQLATSEIHATGTSMNTDDPIDILEGCRLYRIIFPDTRLGLEITIHNYRIVVASVTEERMKRLGQDSKPSVGDILVAIAGSALKPTNNLEGILQYLKSVLKHPPTEFMFAEAPRFVAGFKWQTDQSKVMSKIPDAALAPVPRPPPPSSSSSALIELLDDE